jgi:peptidylprolyl isomerase
MAQQMISGTTIRRRYMSHSGFRRGIAFPALALIFAIMTTSCNENKTELPDGLYAEFNTIRGTIIVELYPDKAPLTVVNFAGLAEGSLNFANKKGPFYDGIKFHRVIEDFMIQGGDPKGNGTGGPGYNFPDETDNGLIFDKPFLLAMANSGPDTNGSQFFITHVVTDWLNGKHTIFGTVVQGQDVVNAIKQGDVINSLKILRVGTEAAAFKADSVTFRELESSIAEQEAAAKEDSRKAIMNEIAARWPDAVKDEETGIYYVIKTEGTGSKPASGKKIEVHYTGMFMDGRTFDSSRDRKETFKFNVGSRQVIPGWDASLLDMKKGERRIIILPPDMAYGSRGAGNGLIPPDSWLVFDVELINF